MPDEKFDVTATDAHGRESRSSGEAGPVESLVGKLRAEGLQVSRLTGSRARRLFEPRRCNLEEFAFFNSELASACKRGAPLPGALRALSRDLTGRRVREALDHVASDVEGGTDLASALARRSDVFPPGYVALVAAGLGAGDLAGTLLLFAEEARLAARVRHSLAGAVAYPLVILFAGTGLLSYFAWVMLPEFESMYVEMGVIVPAATRGLLTVAPVLRWSPLILLGLVLLVPLLWRLHARAAYGNRELGALLLKLPVAGRFFRAVTTARFCRTLANALAGNVPVPEAITLAGLGSGNAAVQAAAERLREAVEEGSTVSDGLAETVFPSTMVWMLHIAEQRGELGPALEECARLQEERARRIGEVMPMIAAAALVAVGAAIILAGGYSLVYSIIQVMGGLGGL